MRDIIPNFDAFGKIRIGDWVYIGCNSLIMPGVTIGNNSLIAAGSVVTKSVPAGIVVGGNPAKFICTIEDYKKRNSCYNVASKGMTANEKRKYLLSLGDNMFISKSSLL